jgi:hypothetical protein
MFVQHFKPHTMEYQPPIDFALPATRHAAPPHSWRNEMTAVYARGADDLAIHLRRRLIERVFSLTGHTIPPQDVTVNLATNRALATLDGVLFQLRGRDLSIVRPCAYCGTGRFETPSIKSQADLGYTLAVWQMYHPECAPSDPPDDISW